MVYCVEDKTVSRTHPDQSYSLFFLPSLQGHFLLSDFEYDLFERGKERKLSSQDIRPNLGRWRSLKSE